MTIEMEIPKVYSPLDEDYDYFSIIGGRGSAKSESVARKLLLRGMQQKRKIVCGREFQSSIKESVYDMLGDFISTYNLHKFYNVLKTEIRANNGTTFSFVGLHHNINSIKSMYDVDEFWGEEAQTFSAETLTILLPTIRKDGARCYFTMNPILEEDPAYQMLVVDPPPKTKVLKVNYDQNPFFPERLRQLMEKDKSQDYGKYLHIWEGQCLPAVEGAVYKDEMQRVQDEDRIKNVPWERSKPVDVFFDLGRSDLTAIWIAQVVGYEYRILRFHSDNRKHFSEYIKYLQNLEYTYGTIYLPHDAAYEQLAAEKTVEAQARESFNNVQVLPRISVQKGIEAARNIFPRCVFDKDNCADGLSHLRRYAYKFDPETGKISREPEHNIHSHGADAFRYMALALTEENTKVFKPKPVRYDPYEV